MNFSLRCGQLLAERANIQRMNIIDRTAWWYRMERIGQPLPEEPRVEQVTRIYTRIDVDKKALELQKRVVTLENSLKEKEKPTKKRTYVIK